jgi:hypothetical protein
MYGDKGADLMVECRLGLTTEISTFLLVITKYDAFDLVV